MANYKFDGIGLISCDGRSVDRKKFEWQGSSDAEVGIWLVLVLCRYESVALYLSVGLTFEIGAGPFAAHSAVIVIGDGESPMI